MAGAAVSDHPSELGAEEDFAVQWQAIYATWPAYRCVDTELVGQ